MPTLAQIENLAAERGITPQGFRTPTDTKDHQAWGEQHVIQVGLCQAFLRIDPSADLPPGIWSRRDSAELAKAAEAFHSQQVTSGSFIMGAILEGMGIQPHGTHARFMRPPARTPR